MCHLIVCDYACLVMDSNNVIFKGNQETICFCSIFEHLKVKNVHFLLELFWHSRIALPGWVVHTLLNMLDEDGAADILDLVT